MCDCGSGGNCNCGGADLYQEFCTCGGICTCGKLDESELLINQSINDFVIQNPKITASGL